MSGIINQTGSRSGTIGRTEGGFTKMLAQSSLGTGEFYQVFTGGFGQYHVVISNLTPTTDDVAFYLRLLNTADGVISTSDYRQSTGGSYNNSGGTSNDQVRGLWNGSRWEITPAGANVGSGNDRGMHATLTFYNPLSTKFYCYVSGLVVMMSQAGASIRTSHFSGVYNSGTAAAGFKLYPSSGSLAQGQVSVYGMGLPDLA